MIKWLTSLERGRLVVAILLIAVVFLTGLVGKLLSEKDKLQESYRTQILIRTDSCEHQKLRITDELNTKFETYLREQLSKFEETQKKVDSTITYNKALINKNMGVIKKLKS